MNSKSIILLTDYKNRFGSKHFDKPYRSGMDKIKLNSYFTESGYTITFINFSDVDFKSSIYSGKNILYTSSEDIDYTYKSYIEDIVFALEVTGANIIPHFKHLRSNNNKVFMELLRDIDLPSNPPNSYVFGSLTELKNKISNIEFPCVLKSAEGASGTGVFLIRDKKELFNKLRHVSKKRNYFEDFKDHLRKKRHKDYIKEDVYRTKFIIQKLIPNLKEDWKVYIFGEKLYIFKRPIQKGRGIKASGGGYDNYIYDKNSNPPIGIYDYAYSIYAKLNVPHVSLDIAFDGINYYLIEFQSVYFGTAGIPYSNGYFKKSNNNWSFFEEKLEIEKVYADSVVFYLNK